MKIVIHCDGGARGNPGPAAWGCVIQVKSKKLKVKSFEISGYLGTTTNNQAEYQAVINGLEWIRDNIRLPAEALAKEGDRLEIIFNLDSQLIVEQLNGRYKIKSEGLKPLYWQARDLVVRLGGRVQFKFVPRAQNDPADKLVNKVLNSKTVTNSE